MIPAARRDGPLAGPDAVAVVRAAYDAFARGDAEAFLGLFAEDAEVVQWDGFPWGGRASGQREVREFARRAAEHIRSRAEPDEVYVAGEDVVAIGRSRGTAMRTGRPFDIRIVHRWRVRDGRIALWHLLVEAPPLLDALEDGDGAAT